MQFISNNNCIPTLSYNLIWKQGENDIKGVFFLIHTDKKCKGNNKYKYSIINWLLN